MRIKFESRERRGEATHLCSFGKSFGPTVGQLQIAVGRQQVLGGKRGRGDDSLQGGRGRQMRGEWGNVRHEKKETVTGKEAGER